MDTKEAGRLGGQARARNLSASKRQEIARAGARARFPMLSGKHLASAPMLSPKHKEQSTDCAKCGKPDSYHIDNPKYVKLCGGTYHQFIPSVSR